MVQHQRWSTSCLTWSYFNRGGLTWNEAQEKAQNKKERREQRSWGDAGPAEEVEAVPTRKDREKKEEDKKKKKKVRRRRTTPSPDVRRGGRKHRKDPDTSGDEERMPKVTRQDRKTFLIQMR